ncbi:MAG: SCO family protein [Methylotenera sp.]|nr:SCO family protein [Methylotenera sp.]
MIKRMFWILALVGLLAACNPTQQQNQFHATDISAVDFGQTLALTDHTGKPRTLADFKGKVIVLFFGYTHCPDVCPTTMADLKQTMKLLGNRADELQVLFATLDPERDKQDVLAQYVPNFDSRFIGLFGSKAQTEKVIKDFKLYAAKVESTGRGGYTIDHSAGTYIFDKTGKLRLYVDYGQKPDLLAADIQQLL